MTWLILFHDEIDESIDEKIADQGDFFNFLRYWKAHIA